jgi:hypothetical protein
VRGPERPATSVRCHRRRLLLGFAWTPGRGCGRAACDVCTLSFGMCASRGMLQANSATLYQESTTGFGGFRATGSHEMGRINKALICPRSRKPLPYFDLSRSLSQCTVFPPRLPSTLSFSNLPYISPSRCNRRCLTAHGRCKAF